ncbi:MAG: prolyl oligopeptidase family serine peptidase [Phycisphaerales bacterium]|nr:prolyl oligopeptidase family serine peptidase [Phycisphaerales bacterium]MBT7171276.1 prolyl oligopeptidase family serine peptidase [Phycisphaerales bacterium]
MKHTWIALLLVSCGLLGGCPVTQDQDTPVDSDSRTCKATSRGYRLYVPSTYDPALRYPVVVTLHGTFPWDTSRLQMKEWKALGEKTECIVVAPVLDSAEGILPVAWSRRKRQLEGDDVHILAVLDELATTHSIDPERVMITGFSAGGYAMYYTGLRHPERFSMLVGRACNTTKEIFDEYTPTPTSQKTPVIIMVGKYDSVLQSHSWIAFRWLRTHGWTNKLAIRKEYEGGHIRRPEDAYDWWNPGAPTPKEAK